MGTENINNRRILKNTLFLYVRMLITLLVSLYTSRVTLAILGIDNYGIYNVVGGVIVMFSFISIALNSATQRFLSVELGKNDIVGYKDVFNTSLRIYIYLSIAIIIIGEIIGPWFISTKMNIPNERLNAAIWVFHFSILTFIINLLKTPFNASIIAHEHMSFYAYISIADAVFKLVIVFFLALLSFDKLILYAFLVAMVTLLLFLWSLIYCRKHFEGCRFSKNYNHNFFKKIFSFSGWSLFGGAAIISANQGVIIIINIFCGVVANAGYGIGSQVSGTINQFVSNFQTAFNPQIVKGFSDKGEKYLELIYRASKISFYLLLILSLPILAKIDFLLDIWLETVTPYSSEFCKYMILSMLIDTLSAPLFMVVQATGNIKFYQIIVSIIISFICILSYGVLYLGFSPVYTALIRSIVSLALLIFRIRYVLPILGISFNTYLQNVLRYIIQVTVIAIGILYLSHYFNETNIVFQFIGIFVLIILTGITIFICGLNTYEKTSLIALAKNKLHIG